MPNNVMYAPIPSAAVAVDAFAKIAAEVCPGHQVTLQVQSNIAPIKVELRGQGIELISSSDVKDFLKNYDNANVFYCMSAMLVADGQFQLRFSERQGQADNLPAFYFENVSNPQMTVLVAERLQKYLGASSKPAIIAAGLSEGEREVIRYHQQIVADLNANVANIGKFSLDQIKNQTEYINKLTTQLEKKFQDREKELNDKISGKQAELDSEKHVFEKAKAEFNDRNRTHVRRELLQRLEKIVEARKSKIGLSNEVATKRWTIHGICIFLLGSSGLLAGISAWKIFGSSTFDWRFEAPLISGMILFVTTAYYYLTWSNQWFSDLVGAEFANRKFEDDITRASWLAELFFEYKEEKQVQLPMELLQSLSKNLFDGVDTEAPKHHPLDQLSKFVKETRSIEFGPDRVKLSKDNQNK